MLVSLFIQLANQNRLLSFLFLFFFSKKGSKQIINVDSYVYGLTYISRSDKPTSSLSLLGRSTQPKAT